MKHNTLTRLIVLILCLGMVFTLSACSKDEEPSEPVDADLSSSEPEEEEEEIIEDALERPLLMEKIDAGIKRNADTVGWLYIPNTEIDDAVLQAADNNYYLRLTEDKVYDIYGCYFMDFESKQGSGSQMSKQNIIYGHSNLRDDPDGRDFSQLFRFLDIDFVRENPYIYYSTKGEEMVWQIFAVMKTKVNDSVNGFYYLDADPPSADFLKMIDEGKARSEYIVDVPVTANDKILTLSTCMAKDNYRVVVMAKLLPATKQLAPTVEVQANPNTKVS